jgi:saccharopine dehydrogenase-like NADP-dependent oxidoreductase
MSKHHIFIAGSGGIGRALGLILTTHTEIDTHVYLGDIRSEAAESAVQFIREGSESQAAETVIMPASGQSDACAKVLDRCDILLDCLPGSQAPRMAQWARKHQLHYANLTEYVQETREVLEIAEGAPTGFVLQTGLAPGFINVLAHQLYQRFTSRHGVTQVDRVSMKVGALTRHAMPPHYYGFTWSPIGVATEYLKEAEVIRDFKKTYLPALSDTQGLIIDGIHYEDDFTSGGAANLPDFFGDTVRELDYRTLRWPGHYDWARAIIKKTPAEVEPIAYLEDHMLESIPAIEEDQVIIYAEVSGKDAQGHLHQMEKSYQIGPRTVGEQRLRAIQHTTAAPLAEIAYQLLSGKWSGPILQSDIPPDSFLSGPFVRASYGV